MRAWLKNIWAASSKGFFKGRFAKKCPEAKRLFIKQLPDFHDKKRSGRPRKTSPYDHNIIRRIAVWSPTGFGKKIRVALLLKGIDVHRTTASRCLVHDFKLKALKPEQNLA